MVFWISSLSEDTGHLRQLVVIFERLFFASHNTQLVPGGDEPFYRASTAQRPAAIISRSDYFSSALHEMAHWCVAGEYRRTMDDYGYWYAPDGRTHSQQLEFERVEIKPQAIEWAFSLACAHEFNFSADNLAAGDGCSDHFKAAVSTQLAYYLEHGLPERAQQLFDAMVNTFSSPEQLDIKLRFEVA